MKSFQQYFKSDTSNAYPMVESEEKDIFADKLIQIRKQVFGMYKSLKELFQMVIEKGSSNSIGDLNKLMSALQKIFIDAGKDFEKFINGIEPVNENLREQIKTTTKRIFKI